VICLGLIFSKLFNHRSTLGAFASMTIAILVLVYTSYIYPSYVLEPLTASFLIAFLLGPPLILLLVDRLRSNNRSRGP
jgi:hypothetical protein